MARATWKPTDITTSGQRRGSAAEAVAEPAPAPVPEPAPEPVPETAPDAPRRRKGGPPVGSVRKTAPKGPRTGRGPRKDQDAIVDFHVGQRVRLRRTLLGMNQTALGEALGLTFQQVQKYEKGGNRISASMLVRIAHVLDVPVSFFFDDLPEENAPPRVVSDDGLASRQVLEFARYFHGIEDEGVRRELYALAKALSKRS